MLKPLIKWPGGKTNELDRFLSLIPSYDRYIEPFVGGGALYFYLNPPKALINDTSRDLMDFYRLVKEQDPEFKRILNLYCSSFALSGIRIFLPCTVYMRRRRSRNWTSAAWG